MYDQSFVVAADLITSIANVAAAVGVVVVIFQLALARRQMRAGFERSFVDKYERIIQRVPLAVLLGDDVDIDRNEQVQRAFFDYFELCEEELYFRRVGKVSVRRGRSGGKAFPSTSADRPSFRRGSRSRTGCWSGAATRTSFGSSNSHCCVGPLRPSSEGRHMTHATPGDGSCSRVSSPARLGTGDRGRAGPRSRRAPPAGPAPSRSSASSRRRRRGELDRDARAASAGPTSRSLSPAPGDGAGSEEIRRHEFQVPDAANQAVPIRRWMRQPISVESHGVRALVEPSTIRRLSARAAC